MRPDEARTRPDYRRASHASFPAWAPRCPIGNLTGSFCRWTITRALRLSDPTRRCRSRRTSPRATSPCSRSVAGGWGRSRSRSSGAVEEETYERIVALKRMHPQASRERRQTEMFLREARLAAALVHPNVVHAFDFGESEGELFLAMERAVRRGGDALGHRAHGAASRPRAGIPPALVASLIADACEGLHAAHELRDPQTGAPLLNVIHRDVSPHNVMVSYEGHVKLLDFGVAKMDSVDPLTRTGEVKGKTAYMSPEQAMGEALDRRSDLFSLGAVLFECVAGQRMYGNGTDLEILRQARARGASEPRRRRAAGAACASSICTRGSCAHEPRTSGRRLRRLRPWPKSFDAFVASTERREGVDAAVIAEVMGSLFANSAAERKRLLNEALAKQVPEGRVAVLRRSLAGPTALAALGARTPDAASGSKLRLPSADTPSRIPCLHRSRRWESRCPPPVTRRGRG